MALTVVSLLYIAAALFNLKVPDTGVDPRSPEEEPAFPPARFQPLPALAVARQAGPGLAGYHHPLLGRWCNLQFIVIKWAEQAHHLDLSSLSMLQGVVAIGVAIGAILAAGMVSMKASVKVIPLGIAMGVIVNVMVFVTDINLAMALMVLIGALSSFFVVPMNALLQHRGHIPDEAGHSMPLQNFNETCPF